MWLIVDDFEKKILIYRKIFDRVLFASNIKHGQHLIAAYLKILSLMKYLIDFTLLLLLIFNFFSPFQVHRLNSDVMRKAIMVTQRNATCFIDASIWEKIISNNLNSIAHLARHFRTIRVFVFIPKSQDGKNA